MKKFKFRLERVLQYRKVVKDEKMRELLICNHQLLKDTERLEELQQAALESRIEDGQTLEASQVHMLGLYTVKLSEAIDHQRLAIMRSEQARDEALAEYIEAAKDARSLETLKQRRSEEYKEEVAKHDEKFLDELSIQKGNRLGNLE